VYLSIVKIITQIFLDYFRVDKDRSGQITAQELGQALSNGMHVFKPCLINNILSIVLVWKGSLRTMATF